jgi:hypothetical protein
MGLTQRETGNFITIYQGKFTQRVPEGTVGASQRTNKLGNVVWEKYYDSFTGKLLNIRTQDGTYGKQWIFDFKDNAEVYHLQLPYSNSFASTFLKILPNIDLSQEMKLTAQMKEVDGKVKSSLFVNQGGNALKHAFTRDNPNGLPPMEQITIKGQQQWDDTAQLEFLHNMVITTILPKLDPEAVSVPAEGLTQADFDAHGTDAQINKDVDEAF